MIEDDEKFFEVSFPTPIIKCSIVDLNCFLKCQVKHPNLIPYKHPVVLAVSAGSSATSQN